MDKSWGGEQQQAAVAVTHPGDADPFQLLVDVGSVSQELFCCRLESAAALHFCNLK